MVSTIVPPLTHVACRALQLTIATLPMVWKSTILPINNFTLQQSSNWMKIMLQEIILIYTTMVQCFLDCTLPTVPATMLNPFLLAPLFNFKKTPPRTPYKASSLLYPTSNSLTTLQPISSDWMTVPPSLSQRLSYNTGLHHPQTPPTQPRHPHTLPGFHITPTVLWNTMVISSRASSFTSLIIPGSSTPIIGTVSSSNATLFLTSPDLYFPY